MRNEEQEAGHQNKEGEQSGVGKQRLKPRQTLHQGKILSELLQSQDPLIRRIRNPTRANFYFPKCPILSSRNPLTKSRPVLQP